MKKYLVFLYIIGTLAATTILAHAGGVWQEVTHLRAAAGGHKAAAVHHVSR